MVKTKQHVKGYSRKGYSVKSHKVKGYDRIVEKKSKKSAAKKKSSIQIIKPFGFNTN